jgi:hypothetical protein
MKSLMLPTGLQVLFNKEEIKAPLPAVIYFSLSKEASLSIDPFNQLTLCFDDCPIRVVSFSLPFHSDLKSFNEAIPIWADLLHKGDNFLTSFFHNVSLSIDELIRNEIIHSNLIAVAGLSRGAFIACHVAKLRPYINLILGFAPLTYLCYAKEFEGKSYDTSLDLESIIDSLVGKKLRFYIGNQDKRTGVEKCFQFINKLSNAHIRPRHSVANVELIIHHSHGHLGHGTLKPTFECGARWIKQNLIIS